MSEYLEFEEEVLSIDDEELATSEDVIVEESLTLDDSDVSSPFTNNEVAATAVLEYEEADVLVIDDYDSPVDDGTTPTGMEFPCVRIKGLQVEAEVEFLLDKLLPGEPNLPLYIEVDGVSVPIGDFCLDFQNIRFCMFRKYQLELFLPDGRQVDLMDGENLYNFIGSGR